MPSMFPWGKRTMPAEAQQPSVSEYVHRVDLFKDLTKPEVDAIFGGTMLRKCAPGTVLFAPDDTSERLFILKEGHVQLYRLTSDGKRLIIRRIGPGMIFGEMGLLGQSMQGAYAEASDDALVCTATRADVARLIEQHPELSLRLLEAVGNRLSMLEERLEQAAFSPVRIRIANFLLNNVERKSDLVAGYTHADIADTIGALRQTVTETLNQLERQGLIQVGQKKIRITDRAGVERLVTEFHG